MDSEMASATIAAYDFLVLRALAIVDEAPYWQHVCNKEHARLSINGDEAKLSWLDHNYDYGTEEELCCFPAHLLFISDAELKAWKVEQRAIYDQQERERAAEADRAQEARERAALAALKAKYEAH